MEKSAHLLFRFMFRLKTNFRLMKLVVGLLIFTCIIFSPTFLEAQSAENSYEKEFFEKLYSIASKPSEDTFQKLSAITSGLTAAAVSNETTAKIIQRLLVEADQSAESNFPKAEIFWQVSELIAAQSNNPSVLAKAFYYRANTLAALDQYHAALVEYGRAIEAFKDNSFKDEQEKSLICEIYAAAGDAATNIDEDETARVFYEKGWKTLAGISDWRKSEPLVDIARALLLGQGNNARQSGDYSSAKTKFSEALSLPGNDNFPRAEVLWEIGKLKRDTGDFAAGATDISEAIKLLDKDSKHDANERINLQANLYNSLGLLMLEQRFAKGAEQNLNQALLLVRSLKDLRFEGTVLKNLSIVARQKGDYETARARARAALGIAVQTDFSDLNISANNILASLAQMLNNHQEAVERLQKSVTLAENSRNVLRSVESKWRLGESLFAFQKYEEAKKLAQESLSAAQKNQWSNLIYLSATLAGRAFVKERNFSAAEEMFELAICEIEAKRLSVAGADIEKVSFMQDKATAYHELLKLLVSVGETKKAFAVAEKIKSRVLEDKAGNRKNLDQKMKPLSPSVSNETAVISYTITDDACFVFVFRPQAEQPKIFVIPEGEKVLTEKVKRFRAGLINFDPSFKPQAKELYALLLKNSESEIGNAKSLLIIPDGTLWELPFQALITSEQKYLIEKYVVAYSPSLNNLNSSPRSSLLGKQEQFLAFANSVPSAPLPETEKEVANISKFYEKTEIFKRLAATEENFKSMAHRFERIHLAVHGEMNSLDSFDSTLLLAPTASEDGRLTISEILKMNLSARMVVLSGCDTSNGQFAVGEGLLSLSWAFLVSGASNVVAAQWAVEERSTADLMTNFYRALDKNQKSSAAALRAAQLQSLKASMPHNHPFYWAAFVTIEGVQ